MMRFPLKPWPWAWRCWAGLDGDISKDAGYSDWLDMEDEVVCREEGGEALWLTGLVGFIN